jgi:hypothetical protein
MRKKRGEGGGGGGGGVGEAEVVAEEVLFYVLLLFTAEKGARNQSCFIRIKLDPRGFCRFDFLPLFREKIGIFAGRNYVIAHYHAQVIHQHVLFFRRPSLKARPKSGERPTLFTYFTINDVVNRITTMNSLSSRQCVPVSFIFARYTREWRSLVYKNSI